MWIFKIFLRCFHWTWSPIAWNSAPEDCDGRKITEQTSCRPTRVFISNPSHFLFQIVCWTSSKTFQVPCQNEFNDLGGGGVQLMYCFSYWSRFSALLLPRCSIFWLFHAFLLAQRLGNSKINVPAPPNPPKFIFLGGLLSTLAAESSQNACFFSLPDFVFFIWNSVIPN